MAHDAVITGMGIVSSLGDQPALVHEALCAGECATGPIDLVGGRELPKPGVAAPIRHFAPSSYLGDRNLRPLDRSGQLAVSAAHLALESGRWTPELREEEEVDLVVGTTFCSAHTITQFDRNTMISGPKYAKPLDFANTVINAAGGHTAIWHNLRGANTTVVAGKVSSLRALKHAQIQLAGEVSKVALVGGVEEFCFETYCAFLGSGHLHRSNHETAPIPYGSGREGFALGEGAAFLVVEEPESASRRNAGELGRLLGHGSSYDISRGRDEQNAVERYAEAIATALDSSGVDPDAVDCIVASANGSPFEDRCEALALERVFGDRLGSVPATAIAAGLGETLGPSGAMQVITFLCSAQKGRLPGTTGATARDPSLPVLHLDEEPVTGTFRTGLVISLGFDGSSAASVVSASTGEAP